MAGSETSGTAMASCMYYLAKNQDVLEKVHTELLSQCSRKEDITFDKDLDSMLYLAAVLEEAMRLYPAQPIFTPRRAPAGGAIVAGYFVPKNVQIPSPPSLAVVVSSTKE